MTGVLADVMQPTPPCVDAGLPVACLPTVFAAHNIDRVLVVRNGKLIGAICSRDLSRSVCCCSATTAGDLAGRHVLTAHQQTPIRKAVHAFQAGIDRVVIVLNEGRPVGSVQPKDLFGWASDSATGNSVARPHLLESRTTASSESIRPAG